MNGCFQANILSVSAFFLCLFNLALIWGPYLIVWILLLSDMDLSTHALTAKKHLHAFGVYQDLIGGETLASNQSLYLM